MEMAEIALMSAVLCIIAPFSIPVPMSPVPLSLATFAVYLAGILLGARKGVICVLLYLLLGMAGLPVFSGFSGGVGILLGPTGGYLLGYLPCVAAVGWLTNRKPCKKSNLRNLVALVLGTMVCYVFGSWWFFCVMGKSYTPAQTVALCVVPYLPLDMVKIVLANVTIVPLRKRLQQWK